MITMRTKAFATICALFCATLAEEYDWEDWEDMLNDWEVDRRRDSQDSCQKVDVNVHNCITFYDESYWNEQFLKDKCMGMGLTDKTITASLCDEFANNPDYVKGLRLALLNTMYGIGRTNPELCADWCMYDPLHLDGIGCDGVGFLWNNRKSKQCWKVLTGARHYFCYKYNENKFEWARKKADSFCPYRVCKATGDPHVHPFRGPSLSPLISAKGDFLHFQSERMRIDTRFRQFRDWSSSVSGIHAVAIEYYPKDCEMETCCPDKLEIYSSWQSPSRKEFFLFNGKEVGWNDLGKIFSTSDAICQDLSEVNESSQRLHIVFTDKIVIEISQISGMGNLIISVPYDAFANDESLRTSEQSCMGDIHKFDCDKDTTIFTYYDFYAGRYLSCSEVTFKDRRREDLMCDSEIEAVAKELCDCDGNNILEEMTTDCQLDLCFSDALKLLNEDEVLARAQAQEIADGYCDLNDQIIENDPWLVRNPTESPTLGGVLHYIVQGNHLQQCAGTSCETRLAALNERWGVRCCAESNPGNWKQTGYNCTLFTKSSMNNCPVADFETAKLLCQKAGGRLCSRDEIEYPQLCSRHGGCGFDQVMVWSSTRGNFSLSTEKYYIVHGKPGAACEDEEGCLTRAVSKHERWNVQCCADPVWVYTAPTPGNGTQTNGTTDTDINSNGTWTWTYTGTDAHNWTRNEDGNCTMYVRAKVDHCVSMDWDKAVQLCEDAGGRLCTRDEIENGCARTENRTEGCKYNFHMIWSSTKNSTNSTNSADEK